MQNLLCATEKVELSVPSTATLATESEDFTEEDYDADLWADWPYCWAIDLHEIVRRRFHSFHQYLFNWWLARSNRRTQAAFQAKYWWQGQRGEEDEVLGLRLV